MLGLAKSGLNRPGRRFCRLLAVVLCGLWAFWSPGVAWADDDEGESQIYAHYVAGQQGGSNNSSNNTNNSSNNDDDNNSNNNSLTDDVYEPVPGYTQENGEPENNNPENNQPENVQPENVQPPVEPEPENSADFPELADSLEVLLWDEASQTNKKSQVMPVNLAVAGSYLPSDVPGLAVSGRTLVPVRLISEQLSATVDWNQADNTVTISQRGRTIVLTIGSNTALVDGQPTPVPDNVSVTLITYEGSARTMVPVRFVVENLNAAVDYDGERHIVNITPYLPDYDDNYGEDEPLLPEPEPEPIPPPGIDENGQLLRRVVVDPGHGGVDPGTNGSGLEEKDINLAVSQKLQTALQNAGFEVIMARADDSYLGLLERAALTVEEDAPVFVSIHCNSAANIPSANGIETYAAPDDADDAELAAFIQKELIIATGAKDRGVKTSPLVVLTHNAAPACLVEIGFMSNSAECAKIADPAYQQKLADAVAAGVKAYFAAKAEQ